MDCSRFNTSQVVRTYYITAIRTACISSNIMLFATLEAKIQCRDLKAIPERVGGFWNSSRAEIMELDQVDSWRTSSSTSNTTTWTCDQLFVRHWQGHPIWSNTFSYFHKGSSQQFHALHFNMVLIIVFQPVVENQSLNSLFLLSTGRVGRSGDDLVVLRCQAVAALNIDTE